MTKILQEKFETESKRNYNEEDTASTGWVSDASARTTKGNPEIRGGRNTNVFYNSLPPGSDIEDQEMCDSRRMPFNTQGSPLKGEDGGDFTRDVTAESLRTGFTRKKLRPTDDQWTNEHQDTFYNEVEVDGVVGFLERGNLLDRN